MRVWQPIGFHNVFEMPECTPVTPRTLKSVDVTMHEVSFHRQRFLAVIYRNGVTAGMVRDGYFEVAGDSGVQAAEVDWYRSVGVPM